MKELEKQQAWISSYTNWEWENMVKTIHLERRKSCIRFWGNCKYMRDNIDKWWPLYE